jgi:hypothetical protein
MKSHGIRHQSLPFSGQVLRRRTTPLSSRGMLIDAKLRSASRLAFLSVGAVSPFDASAVRFERNDE